MLIDVFSKKHNFLFTSIFIALLINQYNHTTHRIFWLGLHRKIYGINKVSYGGINYPFDISKI